jgi:hypothetical protein
VDQISPPFRIALVAMLAVCGLWFTVLKPKAPGTEPVATPAPGTTGLANDVSAAKGAAAASDAANARTEAATGSGTAPATTAASKPAGAKPAAAATKPVAAAQADATAPLLRALDRKHAVVLLFWNKRGVEDKAVRRAVAKVAPRHGRVVVKAVPVSQVGRYEAIVREAKVSESPTVLVIAPNRAARPVVGFTTTAELDQLVGDALAAKRAAK